MSDPRAAPGRRSLADGLRKRAQRIRRRWRVRRLPPAAMVILYHRVMPAREVDPFGLIVQTRHFAEQLDYLATRYEVVPAGRLVKDLLARRHPTRRQVAITFDDGYADNYRHAYPVLERFRLPATIFLATDYVDAGRPYWWDRLRRAVFDPGRSELVIPAPVDRAYPLPDRAARGEALREVWRHMVELEPPARETILVALEPAGPPPDEDRPLTWAEVGAMADSGLVTFGAHTGSHPRLAALDDAAAADEIARSYDRLAAALGAAPELFAYPYGTMADFTPTTQDLVLRAGFLAAFAQGSGIVTPGADPWAIPRLPVSDWSVQRLEDEMLWVWLRGRYLRA